MKSFFWGVGGLGATQPVLSVMNYDKGGIQAMKKMNMKRRGHCIHVVTETRPESLGTAFI